jgi:hypothetical protein
MAAAFVSRYIATMANRVSLPPPLRAAVEAHRCFSGCYSGDSRGVFCADVSQPTLPMVNVHCSDCLTWHVGALTHLLPPSLQTPDALAAKLSKHMRRKRGFVWSVSGYHLARHITGGGFWLAAACLGPGVFVVQPDRGRGQPSDAIHVLMEAFRLKLAPCPGPGMLDAKEYAAQPIYLRYSPGDPVTPDKASLLASPQHRATWAPGFEAAMVVEHLPSLAAAGKTGGSASATTTPPSALASSSRGLRTTGDGEVCSACGHPVRERQLLYGTYAGCLC